MGSILYTIFFYLFFCGVYSTTAESEYICDAVYTADNFFLTSPGARKNHSSNYTCDYLIKGPRCPTFYEFGFFKFDLDDSKECGTERLEIGEERVLCGTKNGSEKYFSEKGSLLVKFTTDRLVERKGFNISVTRLGCEKRIRADADIDDTEQTKTALATESTTLPFRPLNLPADPPSDNRNACCSGSFNSKRFILTSPDFPYSLNRKTQCSYRIEKASRNICRIRLNFLFFWLGSTGLNNCPYGYLQVDGKYLCACNRELKLTTDFDNADFKLLNFKSEGYNLNSQTGFVIELIQDDCPLKYHPMSLENHTESIKDSYRSYNDKSNRVAWPNQNVFTQQTQLLNRRIEDIWYGNYDMYSKNQPKIVKSFYYFVEPDYNAIPSYRGDLEKTTYQDTDTLGPVVTNSNQNECTRWNQLQMYMLTERYGKDLRTCSSRNSDTRSDCVELDYLRGYFRSPGYPYYYPGNLNLCYRFKTQPGYCAIRIFMSDFQIENSYACCKDYVIFGNYRRYCGANLYRQTIILDLSHKPHEDLRFVTDSFRCGRGFTGTYEQIACRVPNYPTTTLIPVIPTTQRRGCDRYIRERTFVIQAQQDHERCSFVIERSSPDVCKIILNFEMFDLDCSTETLIVDDMIYCGALSGRTISLNAGGENNRKEIIYKNSNIGTNSNTRFRISGEQISDDCVDPEVPVAKLIKSNHIQNEELTKRYENYVSEESKKISAKYIVKMRSHAKEICALVMNRRDLSPEKFCDVIRNQRNASHCEVAQNEIEYISGEFQTMELNLAGSQNKVEVIPYEEIDCDNLS